jgi:uncharacterized membrane protein YqiK
MNASAWVAIAAVAVAIVAIVVASLFNVLTLRRASETLALAERTFIRTEERYQADRQANLSNFYPPASISTGWSR